jgi:tetratricopeptide (TPR) repeat protein
MRTAADLSDNIRDLLIAGRDAWSGRDYPRAQSLFEQVLRLAQRDNDLFGQTAALHFLGNVAFNRCRDIESRELHLRALELARIEGDNQGIATSLGSIAHVDVAEGSFEDAARLYDEAVEAYEAAGMHDRAVSLRETADALLSGRSRLGEMMHRIRDTNTSGGAAFASE